jgi:hypothetical protein
MRVTVFEVRSSASRWWCSVITYINQAQIHQPRLLRLAIRPYGHIALRGAMLCEHDEDIKEEKRLPRLYNSREVVRGGFQNKTSGLCGPCNIAEF